MNSKTTEGSKASWLVAINLHDPAAMLLCVVGFALVGSVSPALDVSGWSARFSVYFRSVSLGIGVPLIMHHKLDAIGGNPELLCGVALLAPTLGYRFFQRFVSRWLRLNEESKADN